MAKRGESQLPVDRVWQFVTDTRGRFTGESAIQHEPSLVLSSEAPDLTPWVQCFDQIYSHLIETKSGQAFRETVDRVTDVVRRLQQWEKADASQRASIEDDIRHALDGLQGLDAVVGAEAKACARNAGFPI